MLKRAPDPETPSGENDALSTLIVPLVEAVGKSCEKNADSPFPQKNTPSFDGVGMHDGTFKGDHNVSTEKIDTLLAETSSVTRPPDTTELVSGTTEISV